MSVLLGLDLSLTASAALSCPADWDGRWHRLRPLVVGEPLHKGATEAERIGRCARIAARLAQFARVEGVTQAWLESYGYRQNLQAHSLGELGGLVRYALLESGIDVRVANMTSARKLMCGTIRRGTKPKEIVRATLRQAGAPVEITSDHNLCDAVVCVNWGLSEVGGWCFAQAA